MVQVLEEDDGSGWVKVADDRGGKGLVPASYVEVVDEEPAPPPVPTTSRPGRGSGQYGKWTAHLSNWRRLIDLRYLVRGIYSYQAQGSDELSISEGERLELSAGPTGGQNYADGWWEGNTDFAIFFLSKNIDILLSKARMLGERRAYFPAIMCVNLLNCCRLRHWW